MRDINVMRFAVANSYLFSVDVIPSRYAIFMHIKILLKIELTFIAFNKDVTMASFLLNYCGFIRFVM